MPTEDNPNSETVKRSVTVTSGEVWTVNLCGGHLSIADSSGYIVHRSSGHILTGVYLAIALAEQSSTQRNEHGTSPDSAT